MRLSGQTREQSMEAVVPLGYVCVLSTMATSPVTRDNTMTVYIWSSRLRRSFVYLITILSLLYI